MHKSIATINSPEFINLAPLDINPLMSSCEIKVLYIGENRNHTYISKEVATDIVQCLLIGNLAFIQVFYWDII